MNLKTKLFNEYKDLLTKNNKDFFLGVSEKHAKETFDSEFLETLVFSEKLTTILNRHMAEIEKEISSIYPDDVNKRENISRHCGKMQLIHIQLKQGLQNKLNIYNTGIA